MNSQFNHPQWSAKLPATIGILAIGLLVAVFGIWGTRAQIAGAIIAPGAIGVEGSRQVVQHPIGGVVTSVNVKDGDLVKADDVLIVLDNTQAFLEISNLEQRLFEINARKSRLQAERDETPISLSPHNLPRVFGNEDIVSTFFKGQENLFHARINSAEKEKAQLRQKIQQSHKRIDGITAQMASISKQHAIATKEHSKLGGLLKRQLVHSSRVTEIERELSRLGGETGRLSSQKSEIQSQIAEIEIRIIQLDASRREEAITALRDLETQEMELRNNHRLLSETLSDLEIKAPVSGIIYESQIFAERSVVQSAQPIMYIVPQNNSLVVNARVAPIDIDEVKIGQKATLRLSAFDQNDTPEFESVVTYRSADAITDQNTGEKYYTAKLQLNVTGADLPVGKTLLPGMPVEAYLKTYDRSPLSFFVKPATDYLYKAFRGG